jgi:hypothetical protein
MMFGVLQRAGARPGWRPEGFDPAPSRPSRWSPPPTCRRPTPIRTRSFWLLWIVLFCNVTAGIGILEQASPMIQDFFRRAARRRVSVAAAAGFVGVLSLFNMAGRFAWSSTSDLIGRKPIYMLYLGGGMILYTLVATVGTARDGAVRAAHRLIISFYGGGFATVPAYLRDLFGDLPVGAIHGRLLTAWSAGGRRRPADHQRLPGRQGKPGTLTAAAYRPALFTMVVILAVGFIANVIDPSGARSATTRRRCRRSRWRSGRGARS